MKTIFNRRTRSTQHSIIAAVILILIFGTGCTFRLSTLERAGNATVKTLRDINIFTDAEELQFGLAYVAEHEKKVRLYNDPVVNNYINGLGQSLVQHSKRSNIRYTFKVVDTKGANAYAVPGGFIYIHLDLIRIAKTESELAAVIGHEIGHIVGQHSMKHLTQAYSLELIKQLILDEDSGALKKIIADILAAGLLFRYSRDYEREADRYGVQNLYDAGIAPEGAAKFFETLRAQQRRNPTALEKLLSTHPVHSERIANVNSQIRSLPFKLGLRTDSAAFRQVKRRLGQ